VSQDVFSVAIIGSGFGGQCAAVQCLRNKLDDFIILERRAFAGGTWLQNTYPGAAVDVQSPLYSLSFAQYDWSRMFAQRHELEAYTVSIFDKYKLAQKTRLSQTVTSLEWQSVAKRWKITINAEQTLYAQFVINASGPLSTPVTPKIEGQNEFAGVSFHTNNWDHAVDLSDKNVAIIGSGASAAQVIPAIIENVKALHVFQRTPHWVLPRWDIVFRPWQRKLLRQKWVYSTVRWLIYWLLEIRILGFKYSRRMLNIMAARPAKKHLQQQISDPALRDKLRPDYTIGCKRIILSSTFYPALAHNNAVLHDKHDSIERLDTTGIVTSQGEHIPIDVLIYSTGYDATDGIISYPVIGLHKQLLSEFWSDYPRAYLGTTMPDFPNLFIVTGPNTGIGHTSAIFVIEAQMRYIMNCIQAVLKNGKASIRVKAQAEHQYTQNIHREMTKTVWHDGGCHSWYKSKSGKVIAMFPGFSFVYRRLCKRLNLTDHVLED
jgi:cation diffusion facilitator CzcD-associated flavoprotein CzcO